MLKLYSTVIYYRIRLFILGAGS